MDKVGIITLNGYFNYGNRLQNYALQEFIKMNGYECETIINKTFLDKSDLNKSDSQENAEKNKLTYQPRTEGEPETHPAKNLKTIVGKTFNESLINASSITIPS